MRRTDTHPQDIEFNIDNGGARRDRTVDLNTASVALSQLSYSPTLGPDFRRGAQQYGYRRIVSSEAGL